MQDTGDDKGARGFEAPTAVGEKKREYAEPEKPKEAVQRSIPVGQANERLPSSSNAHGTQAEHEVKEDTNPEQSPWKYGHHPQNHVHINRVETLVVSPYYGNQSPVAYAAPVMSEGASPMSEDREDSEQAGQPARFPIRSQGGVNGHGYLNSKQGDVVQDGAVPLELVNRKKRPGHGSRFRSFLCCGNQKKEKCQMYHNNLITGSLCAALCDERAICDVRKVHGNAHKEVIVTKCQGFCHQGQSVQAFLKHDETSATESDYKDEYSKRNNSSSHVTEETFITLLKKHLPIKSLQAFDSNAFLDILWDDKVSEVLKRERAQNAFTSSVYNTLLFLLRQKEYVLFRAFQNSGVFPMVYGTCGPLYLVESCQRLLPEKLSRNSVTNGLQQGGFQTSSYHNDQGSSIENNAVYMGGYEEQTRIDLRAQSFIPKENRLNQKGFSVSSDKTISIEPAVFGSAGTSRQDSGHGPSISSRSISSIENTKLDVRAGSHQRATQNPIGSGLWPTRAKAAIKILQFLEKLEDVFSGTVHLCDPKLEHFAVSSLDGETRLIDADSVLFERGFNRPRELWGEQDNVCNNHEECNDVLCRGWCYSNTGRCSLERTNNNLQGVCEVLFLQPSFESGIFLKDIPPSIYTDLFNTVCACAKKQRPLPELRAKLVGIFQRSLKGEETSVAFKHFHGESSNFPRVITYENC